MGIDMFMSQSMIDPERLLKIPGKVWVFWKDIAGYFLGCNDLMAESLNLNSRQDIVGYRDVDFSAFRSEAQAYRSADQIVMDTRAARQFEDCAHFKESKICFLSLKIPLLANKNTLIGVIGVSHYLIEESFSKNIRRDSSVLSQREIECLQQVVLGKTAKEIAFYFQISPRTVETHLTNIKNKLNCSRKSEMIRIAIENNLC